MTLLTKNLNPVQNQQLRDKLTVAIKKVLEEFVGQPIHVKVKSSTILHDTLMPEGDQFGINFVVTIYPKSK